MMEQDARIELATLTWKERVLPLNESCINGGNTGSRTQGAFRLYGLAIRCLRPLGHASVKLAVKGGLEPPTI